MEADGDGSHVTLQPVTLKEAADIVVRILDPLYKKGKFATKVSIDVSIWTLIILWTNKDIELKAQDYLFFFLVFRTFSSHLHVFSPICLWKEKLKIESEVSCTVTVTREKAKLRRAIIHALFTKTTKETPNLFILFFTNNYFSVI